jgi:glycosyltransferase involved in cell wall biosynthesis
VTVLHTVGSLGIAAGGPSRTVPSLCEALLSTGRQNLQIVTGGSSRFGDNVSLPHVPVREFPANSMRQWRASLQQLISCNVGADDDQVTILHDHGQWLPINRASASIARTAGIPRIVTPRGMLSPWAMRHRWWKKQIAWYSFARRDLRDAKVVHATSELEANELRQLGVKNPIAVIANGVDRPPLDVTTIQKKNQVLFLSRLHAKKGVKQLVDVWRKIQPCDWDLILAGPDESHLISSLELTPRDTIRWVGEVEGARKWQLLAESRLFVLPSYSENFGVAVAESLIAGTPVITTHGTPWSSVVERGCGWWIPMTPQDLEDAIRLALECSPEDLASMGRRGCEFASSAFGWTSIAEQMADVYRWMLLGGPVPATIRLN